MHLIWRSRSRPGESVTIPTLICPGRGKWESVYSGLEELSSTVYSSPTLSTEFLDFVHINIKKATHTHIYLCVFASVVHTWYSEDNFQESVDCYRVGFEDWPWAFVCRVISPALTDYLIINFHILTKENVLKFCIYWLIKGKLFFFWEILTDITSNIE